MLILLINVPTFLGSKPCKDYIHNITAAYMTTPLPEEDQPTHWNWTARGDGGRALGPLLDQGGIALPGPLPQEEDGVTGHQEAGLGGHAVHHPCARGVYRVDQAPPVEDY